METPLPFLSAFRTLSEYVQSLFRTRSELVHKTQQKSFKINQTERIVLASPFDRNLDFPSIDLKLLQKQHQTLARFHQLTASISQNMLKSFLLGTVVTFTILQHATFTDAFSSQILRPVRLYQVNEPCESMTKLRMRTDDISNGPGDFFDLEATRRQLESLVGSGSLEQVQHEFREVPQRHKVFASIAEESSSSLLPEPPKALLSFLLL